MIHGEKDSGGLSWKRHVWQIIRWRPRSYHMTSEIKPISLYNISLERRVTEKQGTGLQACDSGNTSDPKPGDASKRLLDVQSDNDDEENGVAPEDAHQIRDWALVFG
ncbi:hypothetical protein EDD18DRAFT_1107084 [Armillaria luteobubalina]|uniref:Uncharacterized protein n=1 Tax=Armillaria luteobubalina TaxID=153913 RepID=A0AA39Q1T6_9AGAR|nr:hypothetical protein EDD18DRAFT_1107084 [Armillaria luteobubalina]